MVEKNTSFWPTPCKNSDSGCLRRCKQLVPQLGGVLLICVEIDKKNLILIRLWILSQTSHSFVEKLEVTDWNNANHYILNNNTRVNHHTSTNTPSANTSKLLIRLIYIYIYIYRLIEIVINKPVLTAIGWEEQPVLKRLALCQRWQSWFKNICYKWTSFKILSFKVIYSLDRQ